MVVCYWLLVIHDLVADIQQSATSNRETITIFLSL